MNAKNELWRPLSERTSAPAPVFRTTISRSLETELRNWLYHAVARDPGVVGRIVLRCDLTELHACRKHDQPEPEEDDGDGELGRLHLAFCSPVKHLPDMIDAWLDLMPPPSARPGELGAAFALLDRRRRMRDDLATVLDDARSTFALRPDGLGLRHRVDPAAEALMVAAAGAAAKDPERGSAGGHLFRAWEAAYGLHPDPVRAYSEAIKAVESAAKITVQPNHARATLGSMLTLLRNTRGRRVLDLGDTPVAGEPDAVEMMMRALWTGQTSRHGSSDPTQEETVAEALTAVHLASALVQVLITGALRQVPDAT